MALGGGNKDGSKNAANRADFQGRAGPGGAGVGGSHQIDNLLDLHWDRHFDDLFDDFVHGVRDLDLLGHHLRGAGSQKQLR